MRNGLALLSMLFAYSPYGGRSYDASPVARKCLLKDCKNVTTHGGGCCSAKHSKKWKEQIREN